MLSGAFLSSSKAIAGWGATRPLHSIRKLLQAYRRLPDLYSFTKVWPFCEWWSSNTVRMRSERKMLSCLIRSGLDGKDKIWIASKLEAMGFIDESKSRKPLSLGAIGTVHILPGKLEA
jgi:hypothetical protein